MANHDLRISPDLALPLDAATQTFGFIGRKGGGKSYAAGKLTELLLEAHVQVIVLDVVGNWYGLRLAADGKGDGFDVPVLGGLRGDIPLNAAAGELVADLAADTGRSLIVDLSQFSLADRKRFATAFAVHLWQRKKAEADPTPLHLVIEEAQLLIPQFVGRDDARLVGIYEEIVRLGRNYGIGASLITQRPQSVNKEALTQVECLFVFQVNGTPERKALRDWIVTQGMDVDLVNELPGLPVGTAYVWSPQWLKFLGKVQVAAKRTYDASATPKVGQRRTRRELKPLDLAAMEERMAALIEEKRENDPKELRRRIVELERQLRDRPAATKVETRTERVEVPVLTEAHLAALREAVQALQEAASGAGRVAEQIAGALGQVQRGPLAAGIAPRIAPIAPAAPPPGNPAPSPSGDLSWPQQRILNALASFETLGVREVARNNVAVFSDASPKSSAFDANLRTLRKAGLITDASPRTLRLTELGLAQASADRPITSVAELHASWYAKLSDAQGRILRELITAYPGAVPRDLLAERSGASAKSSAYDGNLRLLRSLGLIDNSERGQIQATGLLFPPQLAHAKSTTSALP